MDKSKLVTIATCWRAAEAELMKTLLEEEGFNVFIADDTLIGMDWLLSNAVGGVKIQVLDSDAERAAQFVEQHGRDSLKESRTLDKSDVDVECEECGQISRFSAESRGNVEACPHCDEYLDVPE
jgi:Putative prokaryotic signal transducing protein